MTRPSGGDSVGGEGQLELGELVAAHRRGAAAGVAAATIIKIMITFRVIHTGEVGPLQAAALLLLLMQWVVRAAHFDERVVRGGAGGLVSRASVHIVEVLACVTE